MTKRKDPADYLPRGPKPKTDPCLIEGCDARGAVRGMCHQHYEAWRRIEHRDRRHEQWREWHDRNQNDPQRKVAMIESHRQASRRYREAQPNRVKESSLSYQRRSRAILNSVPSEDWTDEQILNLYGSDCYLCGEPIDLEAPRLSRGGEGWERGLHIDHVIPLSKGGSDLIANIRPAHAYCNIKKNARMPEEVLAA